MKEKWHILRWLGHYLCRFPLSLADGQSSQKITAEEYLKEIPLETVEIIHRLDFEQFNSWFKKLVCGINKYKEQIRVKPKLFDILERMALLFAYEQRMERTDSDDLELIIRNLEIGEKDKKVLSECFYSDSRYEDKTSPREVQLQLEAELKSLLIPADHVFFISRLKQFKSLRDKLERILCEKIGFKFSLYKHRSAQEIIERLIAEKIPVAVDYKSAYLDDLVGFSVIINDHLLPTRHASEKILNRYVKKVQLWFSSNPGLKVSIVRKKNQAGLKSVNLYVLGLLNHKDFGNLPVRIQFNFQSALCQYSVMCYNYKLHGSWICPPWASGMSFNKIIRQRQLERQLYERLKRFTDRRLRKPFNFYLNKFIRIYSGDQKVNSYFSSLLLWSEDHHPTER